MQSVDSLVWICPTSESSLGIEFTKRFPQSIPALGNGHDAAPFTITQVSKTSASSFSEAVLPSWLTTRLYWFFDDRASFLEATADEHHDPHSIKSTGFEPRDHNRDAIVAHEQFCAYVMAATMMVQT